MSDGPEIGVARSIGNGAATKWWTGCGGMTPALLEGPGMLFVNLVFWQPDGPLGTRITGDRLAITGDVRSNGLRITTHHQHDHR